MLKPGDSFERYTIEAPLGQGGMGCVYRARDARLGRRVALKVLSDANAGTEGNARLLREARAAAAIDHPSAVAIFDVGEVDGAPYIVMELVEGRTLRGEVGGTVPLATRTAQLADVARALASAHRRGLIHRDIKPENVMVRDDGMVKVLDFGIARRTTGHVDPHASTQPPVLPTLTVEGVKLGTPVYMAPEQIRGDALDGRADQFSWGVLAYELYTGRLPWRGAGDALAAMASLLTDPADRAPLDAAGVPLPVQEVVLRALAKRPDDRFASMDDVVRALEAATRGEAVPIDKPPAAAVAPAPSPPGATEAQRFSNDEVRAVLGKAIEQQAAKQGTTKLGFADLLAVAAEVGVDAGSLREASRAIRAGRVPAAPVEGAATDLDAQRDAWIRRQRRDFYRHAGVYLIVNAGLLVLGLVLLSFTPWWVWFLPALGWGVGFAIHGLVALTANKDDWAEHHQEMQRWHESRRRRHEERMAALAAGSAVLTGRRGRQRIEAATMGASPPNPRLEVPPREAEPQRMRVIGVRTGARREEDEEAAEDEAAAAEPDARERRRR